jgi:hypothetical protein
LYILDVPLVDDAKIVVVAPSSLPRPRIIPPPEDDKGEGENEDDDVDHRDKDVPNDLEGRYSKFAQRRSRSGREGAGWWVAPPPPLPTMAVQ